MGAHHGHSHGHEHGEHGHHHHAPADFGRAFAIGAALNIAFVVVEAGFGLAAHSVALLADAGHNLSDVLGLLVAWGAATLARRPASGRFTYGLKSSSILAALANGVLLLLAVGAILWEAVRRLADPPPVAAGTLIWVAAAGIVVNTATALLFARGRHGDLNIRGAYLHMTADALVSTGVVIAGIVIAATGWRWVDPAVSLVIVAVILVGTTGLLRDALVMALQAVPRSIDPAAVRALLAGLPGVARVHDLHIWPMSTTENALTAHLVMPGGHPGDAFLSEVQHRLAHDHAIGHTTLQIELADAQPCEPHHH
ncbi:cobalt-zinc-cadmium efflux system protein [Sphingomonas guangdongensis]|uniref:Cobalt-zinc-cadmium efflux system protein n=1 Tax=Sphingomonas guangdongensis TaxID=1141890 RepID=A0A285R264_9SPHN|nr:cation diffusion facilitator family transporter [Sphingomonas guangdongensis]SOB88185.1 cobalt-zinc-cadmium efflux system protein [Sphingomonas guangdongensis]